MGHHSRLKGEGGEERGYREGIGGGIHITRHEGKRVTRGIKSKKERERGMKTSFMPSVKHVFYNMGLGQS